MTQSNEPSIEQMNEVIARFMGGDYDGRKYWKFPDGRTIIHSNEYNSQMKYHTSWDWLMPVCQKIKAIKYPDFVSLMTMMSATQEMNNGLVSLDLDRTHKGVYKFLIWYNQQKQTNALIEKESSDGDAV